MEFVKEVLLVELEIKTTEMIEIAEEQFQELSREKLYEQTISGKWSVAQCLEHLNLYGDYYINHLALAIKKSKKYPDNKIFKSGWLGNYFALSMLPKQGMKTMKTFKDKDTSKLSVPENVLDRFVNQQKEMLLLIKGCKSVSLNKVKIPITISKFIKISLGDTLRFVTNHNLRHIDQALKVVGNQRFE